MSLPVWHYKLPARGLPKVGESVDIYTAPGLSYRRKVLAHLEGGFLDDTGGSCPRKWLLAEENMIPGWRRVPAGGTSERGLVTDSSGGEAMTDDTNNSTLPKVGEPVEILLSSNTTHHRAVVTCSSDGGQWFDDSQGMHWRLDDENKVPGWRRVERKPKVEPSEREKEALELHRIFDDTTPRREWYLPQGRMAILERYARAEAFFATKAQQQCLATQQLCEERVNRAEQQRDAARAEIDRATVCLDDYMRVNASLEEGLSYQTAENKRLAVQVDELVEVFEHWKRNATTVGPRDTAKPASSPRASVGWERNKI